MFTVSIVSFNTKQMLLTCLDTILLSAQELVTSQGSSTPDHLIEIIVVDNNSSDGSPQMVTTWLDEHQTEVSGALITNTINLGFGAAHNQALDQAQGEWFFCLNSDTELQPDTLTQLAQVLPMAQSQHVGLVAAELFNPDGTLQPQGGDLPDILTLAAHYLMLDDLPVIGKMFPSTQHTGARAVQVIRENTVDEREKVMLHRQGWVGATALLGKTAFWRELGGFSPQIFLYGEDVELCLRAKRAGWQSAVAPSVHVMHHGSASSSSARAILGECEGYLFIAKTYLPRWQYPIIWLEMVIGMVLRAVIFGTMGKKQRAGASFAALRRLLSFTKQ